MKRTNYILIFSLIISITIVSFIKVNNVKLSAKNEKINPVIIIDAGHGGEDGGATGYDGTNEKDINLEISIKLNEILSSLGFQTRMVRETDISIHDKNADTIRKRKVSDIKNRFNIMNEFDKCIYISIHQNKYENSNIWGAQTFYSPNNEESESLAFYIQESIKNYIEPTNKRKIKKAGSNLYILFNSKKPTVLVECGFVSNPNELLKLKDKDFQNKIAMAITNGIINYFITEEVNGTKV